MHTTPSVDERLAARAGGQHGILRVPDLRAMPAACRFAARCPNRIEICTETHPELRETAPSHELRCYNPTPYGS